jgi:hypothetical protein
LFIGKDMLILPILKAYNKLLTELYLLYVDTHSQLISYNILHINMQKLILYNQRGIEEHLSAVSLRSFCGEPAPFYRRKGISRPLGLPLQVNSIPQAVVAW